MESKLLAGISLASAISLAQVNPETMLALVSSLNLIQLITLGISGSVLLGHTSFNGWKKNLPFYLIKCKTHGFQISYPTGFDEVLICPKCVNESQQ